MLKFCTITLPFREEHDISKTITRPNNSLQYLFMTFIEGFLIKQFWELDRPYLRFDDYRGPYLKYRTNWN